jgi:hypothetical protein
VNSGELQIRRTQFIDEQIIEFLKQIEANMPISKLCTVPALESPLSKN